MKEVKRNHFILSLVGTFIAHLILIYLFDLMIFGHQSSLETLSLHPKKRTIKIKRIRTLGEKDGKKNSFSVPLKKIPLVKDTPKQKKIKKLSLKSLKPGQNLKIKKSISPHRNLKKLKTSEIKLPKVTVQSVMRQRIIKEELIKQLAPEDSSSSVIHHSDIQIRFETPEGIKEDELNSVEKIFYSFQKRTFESYFKSFFKSYHSRLKNRPLLKRSLQKESHSLAGRITFDQEGHIIAIKMIKWSNNDEVQNLFEQTLREIRSLPNPPKALLKNEKKEFNIYYQLRIN